mmetsp:Transcript_32242/g.91443  ORF Transcript_32242/g.91443 Transcript_32242/m.91443 type:complete len:504 (+) Transcript_32242:419-1930(+)|eukprot:CAMPEP_0117680446 /NCGR_PEP_ID=MMETSP0804-20121206/18357_1 /TAXON_ID=1074897 /ORGANISM="Tetraselmis astigmatica, Strain CCMP880" /LENGTH=503 /DNA_ID=CAMNT_0005489945 /DNA_START=391 /DNA_END=1902 /DNA_ORIENTATION=+
MSVPPSPGSTVTSSIYEPISAVPDHQCLSEPLLERPGGAGPEDPDYEEPTQKPATVLHSIFNVVNLFMGVGLLSLPYSFRLGGWLATPALALATLLFAFSGHLIVEGFRKIDSGIHSYAALGQQACGRAGRYCVMACTLMDMFGSCAVCLIMTCKQIEGIILLLKPTVSVLSPSQLARILGISIAAPTILIKSFRQLASVSLLGICCSLVVTVAVVLSASLDPTREHTLVPPLQAPPPRHLISKSLPRSVGIFALSMTGHSALPSFRNSMHNPGRFHVVLNTAFAIMLCFNAVVSCVGYWYWGDSVSEIVMLDIALRSPLTDFPGVGILMTALVALNAFSKVPILLLVLEDLLSCALFPDKAHPPPPNLGVILKASLFVSAALLAYVGYNVLGIVMSLMGGLTSMNASVIFPSLFYLRLFWNELSALRRAGVMAVLAFAGVLSVAIISENLLGLIEVAHHSHAEQAGGQLHQERVSQAAPELLAYQPTCYELVPWTVLLTQQQ